MSGTYRTNLIIARDGYYGRGNNARKAAAEMRKIDRRKMRRQAAKAKRNAIREYEDEIAEAKEELLALYLEDDYGDFGDDWEGYDDPMPEPFDYCYENGYWDDYSDYSDDDDYGAYPLHDEYHSRMSYAEGGGYYAHQRLTKEGFNSLGTAEAGLSSGDGKTLAEILEDALRRSRGE